MANPEKGLLGYESYGLTTTVQYWRSFEHLEAFARDADDLHLETWRTYWKRVGKSDRTGIWHETILVRAGDSKPSTATCRPGGLAKAGTCVPLSRSSRARTRVEPAPG